MGTFFTRLTGFEGSITDLTISKNTNRIYLATTKGIYIGNADSIVLSTNIARLNSSFVLSQNYPNPFNPTTNIGFRVANFGLVTLKIYDVLGKEVATLVNEYKSAGEYKVEFDASVLPSGVYFYQLKAGSFVETKKMVLLR